MLRKPVPDVIAKWYWQCCWHTALYQEATKLKALIELGLAASFIVEASGPESHKNYRNLFSDC